MFSEQDIQNRLCLRPMTQGDLEEVVAIEQAGFSTPWTRNLFFQELSSPLSRNFTIWMTMEDRQVMAGYAIFWVVAGEVHLQKIAIKPEFRRRNAATCLMEALLQSARNEKCPTVILEVRRSNTAAIKLYEKFGFMIKGVRPSYYSEEGEDALIMGRDIPFPDESFEL